MSKAYDEELGGWVCTICKKPFDSDCPRCGGYGEYHYDFDIRECDCCGCSEDYKI